MTFCNGANRENGLSLRRAARPHRVPVEYIALHLRLVSYRDPLLAASVISVKPIVNLNRSIHWDFSDRTAYQPSN